MWTKIRSAGILGALLGLWIAGGLGPFIPSYGLLIGLLIQSTIFAVGLRVATDTNALSWTTALLASATIVFFVVSAAFTVPQINELGDSELRLLDVSNHQNALQMLGLRWGLGISIGIFGWMHLLTYKHSKDSS